MSSTNPIPSPIPLSKDPPSTRPPSIRNPSYTTTMPPPPPRPLLTTRTPSFDPQAHLLSPSPLLPPETTSQTLSSSHSPPPTPQRFTPFFTLITDTTTQTTHHPSKIHYIFSDDDASELLTSSLLKATQAEGAINQRGGLEGSLEEAGNITTTTTSSSSSTTFRKTSSSNPPNPKASLKKPREERTIIIDLSPSLDCVEKISSCTPDWQVLSASIERAPSFDPANGEEEGEKGLMLRVEGVDVRSFREGVGSASESASRSGVVMGEEEMQGLLEGFDRKMALLRRVVGEGGEAKEMG